MKIGCSFGPVRVGLVGMVAMGCVAPAFAGAKTWDGGAGTMAWHDAANWNPDGVPGPRDEVTIGGSATTVEYVVDSPAVATLTVQSSALLNVQGGTLSIAGALAVNNATLAYLGGDLAAAGGVVLDDSTLDIGPGGTGAIAFILRGNCTLPRPANAEQTLWVQGGSAGSHAMLTLTTDSLENIATIRLESINSTYSTQINVPAGETFTNSGVIEADAGSGGQRRINGNFTNVGQVTVEAGVAMEVTGSGAVMHLAGGSIEGEGTFVIQDIAFVFSGGQVTDTLFIDDSSIEVQATVTEPSTVIVHGNSTLVAQESPAVTIWVQGSNTGSHATLTLTENTVVNAGTIRLESLNSTYTSQINVPDGYALENHGLIDARVGSGGARRINGNFTNHGQVLVEARTELEVTGTDSVVHLADGSIAGDGTFVIRDLSFVFSGGQVTDTLFIDDSSIEVQATVTEPSTVIVHGNSTLVAQDSPVVTIWVQGSNAGSHATLTLTEQAVANAGTIRLESMNSTYTSQVNVPDGHALVNHGLIVAKPGTGGARRINGSVTNFGQIHVEASTVLEVEGIDAVVHLADGIIDGPGTFEIQGIAFVFSGGQATETLFIDDSSVEVQATVTEPSTVIVHGSSTLVAQDSPAVTIWIQGANTGSHATLTLIEQDVTNAGAIRLESINSTYSSRMVVPAGFVLINEGHIESRPGTGGVREIDGSVINHGSLDPGFPHHLTITGDYTQSSSGIFHTQFGGATAGSHSLLTVDGVASLAGGIEVTRVAGYVPAPGSEHVVLEAEDITGAFDDIASCDPVNVSNTTTDVIVTFGEISDVLGDLTGNGSVDVADLLQMLGAWGLCPDDEFACCPADLDEDGAVNVADLLLLLANWG